MASPFDRKPQSPFTSGQPPSFKTNVNRAKTKKWVEAKAYSYEGDDWGEYDEGDEYGVEPSLPAQRPTGLRQHGQTSEQQAAGGRSFTNPIGMPGQAHHRSNSFEQGDERRAFSAGTHPPQGYGDFPQGGPQQAEYNQQPRGPSGAPLQVQTDMPPRERGDSVATSGSRYPSATQSATSDMPSSNDPTRRRDFSPSAMPAPLLSRTPQSGTPQSAIDTSAHFTPRKSSLSQSGSPTAAGSSPEKTTPTEVPPRQQTPSSAAKPLPFIRPADIYKRMEEERARERASQESSRPSMESIMKPREETASPPPPPRERSSMENLPRRTSLESVKEEGRSSTPSQQRATPLATVAERKSEYGLPASQDLETTPTAAEPSRQLPTATNSGPPTLPQFAQTSDFGSGFWGDREGLSAEQLPAQSSRPADTSLQHQPSLGFRSVVKQAFDRPDESKSIPATPSNVSNMGSLRSLGVSGSDISRSNTDSTAGISPIMSRMPSVGASSAPKGNNTQLQPADLSSTPSIEEEPAESSRPPSRTIPRKPSPSHSREPSAGSVNFIPGYRRDLNTPPSRGSPARSPVIEAQRELADPEVAELTTEGPGPTLTNDMTTREADLASPVNTAMSTKELDDAERELQTDFVESHHDITASTADTLAGRPEGPTKSRSQSPSKSRVHELAGRFDDIAEANSRRNSSHSISSRNSWKQGAETSDLSSQRPPIEQQPSFRPKLPGQWESFATSRGASTPSESDAERDIESQKRPALHPVSQEVVAPEKDPIAEEIDLTPTTSTHPLASRDTQGQYPSLMKDPMAALAAAGTAMGEAFTSSFSPTSPDEPQPPEEKDRDAFESGDSPVPKREFGNIYGRPPAPDRLESNVSSIPPSPPPKDAEELHSVAYEADESDDDMPPPPVPLKSSRNPSGEHPMSESILAASPPRPAIMTQLSADTAFDDEEHDRLRQDIVRTLSPVKDSEDKQHGSLDVLGPATSQRDSSVLPAEYDTYWEGARSDGSRYSQMPGEAQVGPQGVEMTSARPDNIPEEASPVSPTTPRPNLLDQRFSWERSQDSNAFAELVGDGATGADTKAGAAADGSRGSLSGRSSPAIAADDLPRGSPSAEEIPAPVSPVVEAERDVPERTISPPTHGLHVINATGQEEAVDMPPRLATPNPEDHPAAKSEESPSGKESRSIDEKAFLRGPSPEFAMHPSQVKQRLLPFREIAAIPNPQERIRSFNSTREQFATMDTGLRGWLTTTIGAHPEHSNMLSGQIFPITSSSTFAPQARVGHKASPSLSKFSNLLSPTSPQQSQSSDNPLAMQGSSPSSGPSASGAGQRSAGGGVGTKMGKDLLNTAGALGGKATTGAKGLFAKGRSKFRSSTGGDKVD